MKSKLLKFSTLTLSLVLPLSVVVSCSKTNDDSRQIVINKITKVFETLKGEDDPYVSTKYTMLPSTFTLGNITPYTMDELGISNQIDFKDLNYKIFIQSINDELGYITIRIDLTSSENESIKMVKVSKIKGFYATRDRQDELDLTEFMSKYTSANYQSSLSERMVGDVYFTYKPKEDVSFEELGIVTGASVDEDGNHVDIDVPAIDWTGYQYSFKLTSYQDYEDKDLDAHILGTITVTKGNVFKKRDIKIKGYKSTYKVSNEKLNSAEEIMRENATVVTSKTNALVSSIGQVGMIVTQEQIGISIPTIANVTYRFTIESVGDTDITVRYRLSSGALPPRTGSILVTGYRPAA